MIKLEVTTNEYEQICSALHYASIGEWKPEKYYANQYDLAAKHTQHTQTCLLYTSPSPRDRQKSRMPSSA